VVENSPSIVIDCVIKSNPSILALEWFKDKYLLSNTLKYQILPNNSLLVRNVQRADAGQYYCTCNNTLKKVVSPLVKLEIVDSKSADVVTMFASVTSQNKTTRLPCKSLTTAASQDESSEDDYEAEVSWFKLNGRLPANRYSTDADGSLSLSNVRTSDSGVYLCKVNGKRDVAGEEKLIKLIVVQSKINMEKMGNPN
jgi:hypothetical protein